jgi:DNA-binding SARP family transcriptional activator
LVREFLEARLRHADGDDAVNAIHRRAAEAATSIDWRVAAHHFREAGDPDRVASVVASAVPEIMGSGDYGPAADFIRGIPRELSPPGLNLVDARIAMQDGAVDLAQTLSERVLSGAADGSRESDFALLNLATVHLNSGNSELAVHFANRLSDTTGNRQLKSIADGVLVMEASGKGGNFDDVIRQLLEMAEEQRGVHPHYFGVSMLNLATASLVQDDPSAAVLYADQAIDALRETSSRIELSSALMAKAAGLMMLGRLAEATAASKLALDHGLAEATLEQADIVDSYGRPEASAILLESLDGRRDLTGREQFALHLQSARFLSRRGLFDSALSRLGNIDPQTVGRFDGNATAHMTTAAYVAVVAGSINGAELAAEALRAAKGQGAKRWQRVAELMWASTSSDAEFSASVVNVGEHAPWNLTYVADLVGRRIGSLDEGALFSVGRAVQLHPLRWRSVLRDQLDLTDAHAGLNAGMLLEMIGDRSDVPRLRAFSRRHRRLSGASVLGRRLARRIADKVHIEDQNRVTLHVGERVVVGSSIRRKVLALLCFMLTRPDMASTRDQVLEALWPDLDPMDAVNSLNQTVYFLRRTFEEGYVDDLSPGYVHHDSDLIWLDMELVTSRSNECRALIKSLPPTPSPDEVEQLATTYHGRFALDFEYEEWAAPFRDWLHASFLEIVERAVASDMDTGHFERGIRLARRVLDIDPSAEQVEVSLLRLYRSSGAHAAAAEQYSHYASAIRDQLGLEPPALESL